MNCTKRSFLKKEDAVKRVAEIRANEDNNKIPIRSYRCEICGNFHLTSWSKKRKQKVNKFKIIAKINNIENEAEFWKKKNRW